MVLGLNKMKIGLNKMKKRKYYMHMRLGKSLIIITILIWLFIVIITLFTRIDIKYVDSFTPQEEEYLYNNFFNGKNEKIRLCLFSHNSDQTGRGGGTKLISMVKKEDYEVLNNVINYKICTKKEKGVFDTLKGVHNFINSD